MKKKTKNYFASVMAIVSILLNANTFAQYSVKRSEAGKTGMHASFIEYNAASAPRFEKGKIPVISENGSITSLSDMILINSQKDELGFEHYRYQQTYKGIPIENAIVAVHVKDGKVLFQNGKLVKTLPEQLSTPSISSKTAIASALNNIKAKQYAWENTAAEAQLKKDKKDSKATYYPKGDLVWYSTDGGLDPSKLKLAYKLDVVATDPYIHQLVYVDANNENILGINEIGVKYIGAVGKAHTVYSGIQTINTDLWKVNIDDGVEDFRLFDQTRGNGIQTLNGINESYKYVWLGRRPTGIQLISNAKEYIDHDNDWDNINNDLEQYAADAHWGAEKAFDYYKTKFNFTRIGSNNNPFRVVANFNTNAQSKAIAKFANGPASATHNISRLGFLKREKFIGTGFAQPNTKPALVRMSMSGIITDPKASKCLIGFKVSRPWSRAVVSPK